MSKKPVQLDAKGYRKFSIVDKLAYAAGDFGCNMSFALKSYLMVFWTQYMGITEATYALCTGDDLMAHAELFLQRQKEIEMVLLELMQTIPYQQITVTDLTKRMGIARKSFYHYYTSKEECFESLTDRLIQESALYAFRQLTDNQNAAQIYGENIKYWMSQKPFLDAVIQNNLWYILLARTVCHIRQEEKLVQSLLGTPTMEYDEDILLFYVSGQLALMLRWCAQGFPLSVEEMARKYFRLMHSPLLGSENK